MNEVEMKVRNIIKENLELLNDVFTIGKDEDLSVYGMDSVSAIKVIVAIEQEFEFEFNDEDLGVDSVRTVQKNLDYIKAKLLILNK